MDTESIGLVLESGERSPLRLICSKPSAVTVSEQLQSYRVSNFTTQCVHTYTSTHPHIYKYIHSYVIIHSYNHTYIYTSMYI